MSVRVPTQAERNARRAFHRPRFAAPYQQGKTAITCGTVFSREGVWGDTAKLMAYTPAYSRLKPVPLSYRDHLWDRF